MANVMDNDVMSLQGSINALVVLPRATTPEQMTAQTPTEWVGPPAQWTQDVT